MGPTSSPLTFRLGYVTLATADIDRAVAHYGGMLGLTEVERGRDGTRYLSIGCDHHDLALRPAAGCGLDNLGYQLVPGVTFRDLERRLRENGLEPVRKGNARPGVADLVEVVCPGGGTLHFYEAMAAPAPGFRRDGVGLLRLGHVCLMSTDAAATIRFHREVLGFGVTDRIGDAVTFMTCNRDHHVVNVVEAPIHGLHHIAFELTGRAHHVEAADLLRGAGVGTLWGPSRLTAGHALSACHLDPDGVLVELYTDLDVFIPELGRCEPRPWHEELPMTPRRWTPDTLSAWEADIVFDVRPIW